MTLPATEVTGAPDWQRAVTAAQRLVGTIASPRTSVVCNVPANITTLWIYVPTLTTGASPTVVGVTTGIQYPVFPIQAQFLCPIVTAIDSQFTVTIPNPQPSTTYIVGEQGNPLTATVPTNNAEANVNGGVIFVPAELVAGEYNGTPTVLTVGNVGNLFQTPVPPGVNTSDHLFGEIQMVYFNSVTTATILAAPGAGKRYRFYGVKMWAQTGVAGIGEINVTYKGVGCIVGLLDYTGLLTDTNMVPLSGLPLDANTSIVLTVAGGVNTLGNLFYTTETV